MNPLFCFKLDEETGIITRIVIEKYREYHPSPYLPRKLIYTFVLNNYRHDLCADNLDRCVNWKYYTFDDDLDRAKQAFRSVLRQKITKAKKDLERFSKAYEMLEGIGDEENRDIFSV